MKDQILKLRSEGKTYEEIRNELNCAKSTVAYYCSGTAKDKSKARVAKHRESIDPLSRKIENFKARRALKTKAERFQCRVSEGHPLKEKGETRISMKSTTLSFKANDVIKKFGKNPTCALTGRKVDWENSSTYTLDHIVPVASGGSNSLENLNLVCPEVNRAKSDLSMEEFFALCREVLEHNGYEVKMAA